MTPLSRDSIHSQRSECTPSMPNQSPALINLDKYKSLFNDSRKHLASKSLDKKIMSKYREPRRYGTLPSINNKIIVSNHTFARESLQEEKEIKVNPENLSIIKKVLKERRMKRSSFETNALENKISMKESEAFKRKELKLNPEEREIETNYTKKMVLRRKLGYLFERRQRYPVQ